MKQKHARKRALPEPPKPRREVPRVNADPEQGLSLHQVKERQQHGWANDPVESPTKTVGEIVRENVCTFFNFIFVVLAALLIAVGSFEDMLFLLIAAANTGIGIFQQLRSKQTIDKLNLLAAPRANVVREGNLISVPSAQLVRDDVAELSSGDQIPADATVLSGQIQVNEALITGEADAITKAPGDELLSGSFVVSGRCRARLDRVGAESYAARLTTEAKKDVTVGKSEMMSSLDKLIRIIGILLVKRVKGGILLGILITWVLGILCELAGIYVPDPDAGMYSVIPTAFVSFDFTSLGQTFGKVFQADFAGVRALDFATVMFAFLFVDIFDTLGTLIGVASKADMLDKDGKLPRIRGALLADAVATSAGAILGTSTTTTFVESASGVTEGGRTGLTAVTTGVLFLLALIFSPLFLTIPSFATAPALIVVGFYMISNVVKIDFDDPSEGLPAFLAIAAMPLAYSISEGIAIGVISYTLLNLITGKARSKKISWLMYVLTVLFILKYVFL